MSTNNPDIYTIRSDGSGLRRVTSLSRATAPKWSADYSQILFVRIRGKTAKHPQLNQLWTVHSDGSGLSRLTDANVLLAQEVALLRARLDALERERHGEATTGEPAG